MPEVPTAQFRGSVYGRIGHLIMAIPVFGGCLLFAWLFYSGLSLSDWSTWLIAMPCLLMCTFAFSYCLRFLFEQGIRVQCTSDALEYRGFLGSASIPWRTISEVWIDFGGKSPFVFLVLRTRAKRAPYWINASGLNPNYVALFRLVRRLTPEAKVWVPRSYAKLDAATSRGEQVLYETLVDNSLTLIRADDKEDARRSTER